MTDECIHGLPTERCDICTPAIRPAPAPARARIRRTSGALPSSTTPRRSSDTPSHKKPLILSEQRVHHLTHIGNLTGMLVEGAVLADTATSWDGRPEIDISSTGTREARRSTTIAGTTTSVADYVPFFLSPQAELWEGMRAGTPDPRLARTARALPASEFVMLVTTISHIATDARHPLVADGDAADPHTRFSTTRDDAERSLRAMLGGDDALRLRAEVLVFDSVPFRAITLIGVANDKARSAVRSVLAGSEFQPRIAVHPPWFAAPSAAPPTA